MKKTFAVLATLVALTMGAGTANATATDTETHTSPVTATYPDHPKPDKPNHHDKHDHGDKHKPEKPIKPEKPTEPVGPGITEPCPGTVGPDGCIPETPIPADPPITECGDETPSGIIVGDNAENCDTPVTVPDVPVNTEPEPTTGTTPDVPAVVVPAPAPVEATVPVQTPADTPVPVTVPMPVQAPVVSAATVQTPTDPAFNLRVTGDVKNPSADAQRAANDSELAYTGAKGAALAGIAASILSAGAALVLLSRRRNRAVTNI